MMSYDKKIVVPVNLFKVLKSEPLNCCDGYTRLEAFINLIESAASSTENDEAAFNGESFSLAPGQVAVSVQSLEKKWNWDRESARYFLQTLSALDVISYETHGPVIIFSFPFLDNYLIVDSEDFFPESLPCDDIGSF